MTFRACTKQGWYAELSALQYKKLVDPSAEYIAQVAHYPSYQDSELSNGGYAGLTQIIVVNGTKKRVLLADTNEPMNVGRQNPAIQVTDADAVYLITQSNRTFDMGKIEDFAGMTQYAIVDNLISRTRMRSRKNIKILSVNSIINAALAPHATKAVRRI